MREEVKSLSISLGIPIVFSLSLAYGLPHIVHAIPFLNVMDLKVDEIRQNLRLMFLHHT